MLHKAREVVIWSADVSEEKLWERLDAGGHGLRYVKIDRNGVEEMGFGVLDQLRDAGYLVFDDAKIVEVPSKVVAIANRHLEHKPWMLNCMAGIVSTGNMDTDEEDKRDALKRFADACRAAGTLPCAVTVLTSKSGTVVSREFNNRTSVDQVLTYVEFLLDAGFTDIVCSPEECVAIRSDGRFDGMSINTPGIRLPGSETRDQARTGTPSGALQAGATRLVIGQDLTSRELAEGMRLIQENLDHPA